MERIAKVSYDFELKMRNRMFQLTECLGELLVLYMNKPLFTFIPIPVHADKQFNQHIIYPHMNFRK